MTNIAPAKIDRLRSVAERAFQTRENGEEADHALKIFDRLCASWGVEEEAKEGIWGDLRDRCPELDRRRLLRRMGRLLRKHVEQRAPVDEELQKWRPWSEEPLESGDAKLTEHVDLRAAKYLLSLKEDEFKNLYLERAK